VILVAAVMSLPIVELAAALALFAGLIVTLFTIAEKVTGVGQRWLSRGIASGVAELLTDLHDVKVKQDAMGEILDEVQHLQRYHLGENNGAPRMHDRVAAIEHAVRSVADEQAHVRRELRHEDGAT
jgi:hypothetical protein